MVKSCIVSISHIFVLSSACYTGGILLNWKGPRRQLKIIDLSHNCVDAQCITVIVFKASAGLL